MKTWQREDYKVVEVEYDHDLRAFEIIEDGEAKHTIYSGSIEEMNSIIEDLNNGECVDGWEDGMGKTIRIGHTENELGE